MGILKNAMYAEKHTKKMNERFLLEIEGCTLSTKRHTDIEHMVPLPPLSVPMEIQVLPIDTVSALMCHKDKERVCVLNFANYTAPGGLFMSGSSGQEESLCKESYLYNVLLGCQSWFDENRQLLNNYLYQNRALYSPYVRFERHNGLQGSEPETARVDVLTCSAPNARLWKTTKNSKTYKNALREALYSRIDFIMKLCAIYHPDVFIAGAFGCGAFGNDVRMVARIFKDVIVQYPNASPLIIFAVPDKPDDENFKVFDMVFNG